VKYLLDTNICVFIIRNKSQLALQRLRQHPAGEVGISTVTLAELRYGADKSQDPPKNHTA
jgi:tRNA(fMet)-specific endonuclease VapC